MLLRSSGGTEPSWPWKYTVVLASPDSLLTVPPLLPLLLAGMISQITYLQALKASPNILLQQESKKFKRNRIFLIWILQISSENMDIVL